jgi:hypothetical protein
MRIRNALAGLLIAASFSAQAYNVVFDPASTTSQRVVNRIEGLAINETGFSGIYDVIFTGEAVNDVRAAGGHPLLDLPVSSTQRAVIANAIVDLVVGALNTTDANKVGSLPLPVSGFGYLPYLDGTTPGTFLADRAFYSGSDGPWTNLEPGSISSVTNGFVTISLVPVPLPAGLPLLLTALGSLGIMVRKRRTA